MAITTEAQIAQFKAKCVERFGAQEAFGKPETQAQVLERCRASYRMSIEKHGEVASLTNGADLAMELRDLRHTIEAWRLVKRLIAISKQCHGPGHKITIDLERRLLQCKAAYVGVWGYGIQIFEVISYEADKYVVRGPVDSQSAHEEMVTMEFDAADVTIQPYGTPVVIHGFKNKAAYLNGKIGDMRSFDATTGRYGVYFEDKSINPKGVKPENLRILFELPDN